MKVFLDTEFYESGPQAPIELISIGLCTLDGREYYAELTNNLDHMPAWFHENVKPHLLGNVKPREQVREEIEELIGLDPVFWGYFSSYDWVLFSQLWGTMLDLPHGWPKYCLDLKQLTVHLNIDKAAFPPKPANAHNALADAKWNRELYKMLMK